MIPGAEQNPEAATGVPEARPPTPDPRSPTPALLEPELLRKLERLSLLSRRAFAGRMQGDRKSPRRGASVEFADYRDYSPGDDFRRIDWNAYARLDRLFLKLFAEEEDLCVHLLLDSSRSMEFGSPTKWDCGRRAVAALAYMSLFHLDRVAVGLFGDRLETVVPPARGRGRAAGLLDRLGGASPGGGTDVGRSLREYAARMTTPGVAVVASDFLSPGWEEGLRALAGRRCEVTVLHLMDPGELHPRLEGDLRLVDSETGETREITVSPALLRRYREAVDAFCGEIEAFCQRYGMTYLRAETDQPFEDLIFSYFRHAGVIG
ncbi:MAG: DUF58 domain-containing protein [Armatimonadetes bacterium]|nr:DUF58 domain-containing protein [Armatimonadota bacterium]